MDFEVGDGIACPGRALGRFRLVAIDETSRVVTLESMAGAPEKVEWSFEMFERNQPVLVSRLRPPPLQPRPIRSAESTPLPRRLPAANG